MNKNQTVSLWREFKAFYLFSPQKQSLILSLMLIQGVTAGIGLLFIIPLLQIVGIDMGVGSNTSISDTAYQVFNVIGITANLTNILLSYIIIIAVIASLRYQLSVMTTQIQQRYIAHLRDSLYRGLLHSRWQFIVENKMSNFIHCLSSQVQSIAHASNLMLTLLSQMILTLVMVGLVVLLSWKMTLLAIVCATTLFSLLLPFNRLIYGTGQKELLNFKSIFKMLTEQLASLKMIKVYGSESYHAKQMQQVSQTLEAQQLKFSRMNALTQWVYMVGSVIAFSVFFYVAKNLLAMPLATILLLLIIFSRLLPQISSLQKTYQQLLYKVPAFNDINEMKTACKNAEEPVASNHEIPKMQHNIQLKNVSFHYPQKDVYVIDNLSVKIKKNETVALVGHSGAGKSTLADLIAGLIEPSKGQILSDDLPLEGKNRIAWRKSIAYVTQEVYLFHDSIRANLSWVTPKQLKDADLWRVLELAAADDFVSCLPQGLDTLIGDRGIKLSGGERQRLALARALLTEPQLLILDEATSALDHQTEKKIQQSLEQLQGTLTILIIAHRETTIAHADKRIYLAKANNSNAPLEITSDKIKLQKY